MHSTIYGASFVSGVGTTCASGTSCHAAGPTANQYLSPLILIAFLCGSTGSSTKPTAITVSWNGLTATKVVGPDVSNTDAIGGASAVHAYYVTNAASASTRMDASWTGTQTCHLAGASYTGVDQVRPVMGFIGDTAASMTSTITLNVDSENMAFFGGATGNGQTVSTQNTVPSPGTSVSLTTVYASYT